MIDATTNDQEWAKVSVKIIAPVVAERRLVTNDSQEAQENKVPLPGGTPECRVECDATRIGQLTKALDEARTWTNTAHNKLNNKSYAVEGSTLRRELFRNFFPDGVTSARRWISLAERRACNQAYRAGKAANRPIDTLKGEREGCLQNTRDALRKEPVEVVRDRALRVLAAMRNSLDSGVRFSCPSKRAHCCKDSSGGFTQRITRPSEITACGRFFGDELTRNIIHEIAHSVGMGLQPVTGEIYRGDVDTWSKLSSDRAIHMADAYAWFVKAVQ